MGSKSKVVHEKEEFQLDRKKLGIDEGMIVNNIIDGIFNFLNNLDLTNDHKSDVAQVAPIIAKYLPKLMEAMPVLQKLFPLLSADGFIAWVKSHPEWFKDMAKVEQVLKELQPHIAQLANATGELAKLAPKT